MPSAALVSHGRPRHFTLIERIQDAGRVGTELREGVATLQGPGPADRASLVAASPLGACYQGIEKSSDERPN